MQTAQRESFQKAPAPFCDNETAFHKDMLDLFLGFNGGHVGKYCYDGNNWDDIIENAEDYYVPRSDNELVSYAANEIENWIPQGTPYVDFGVGGPLAFRNHVLPITQKLNSTSYTGVDFCEHTLEALTALRSIKGAPSKIHTVQTDFFVPSDCIVAHEPSLGVMNGLTVTNNFGTLYDKEVKRNFIPVLKQLSRFTKYGWLLLTIDTNQDEASLLRAYVTSMTSRLYLNVFHHMARTLPVRGFNPFLFAYTPEWHPDIQLFAHIARAVESQVFFLGSNKISIKKGDTFHLLNSYKFSAGFFEECASGADLAIQKVWTNETPMKLYLLAGKDVSKNNLI